MHLLRLTKGVVAMIDDADRDAVIKAGPWHPTTTLSGITYITRNVRDPETRKRGKQYLHDFLVPTPPGLEVDHRNRRPSDCRRLNMRVSTHQQNQMNRRPWSKVGLKGVELLPSGKFRARCYVDGKFTHLGTYTDKKDAGRAYDRAVIERFGSDFVWLNFPGEVDA
jgi:HNH endonuclease